MKSRTHAASQMNKITYPATVSQFSSLRVVCDQPVSSCCQDSRPNLDPLAPQCRCIVVAIHPQELCVGQGGAWLLPPPNGGWRGVPLHLLQQHRLRELHV